MPPKSVLVISDIEGSSGCWDYHGSRFLTRRWYQACVDMSLDVGAVTSALFHAGVLKVVVQDFHRTGYNLIPDLIDKRVRLQSGYRYGPVPGIGKPPPVEAVLFLGMHAASGTNGFLPHTLTSRVKRLMVNGRPLPEVELFSAALAPFGIQPVFFSGCPVACEQAKSALPDITCYSIDKSRGKEELRIHAWRKGLTEAAVCSLDNHSEPYFPRGPFEAVVTMRDGPLEAARIGKRWGFSYGGSDLVLPASNLKELYDDLIRLCYLMPWMEKVVPATLAFHRLVGRAGLEMVRMYWKRKEKARTA